RRHLAPWPAGSSVGPAPPPHRPERPAALERYRPRRSARPGGPALGGGLAGRCGVQPPHPGPASALRGGPPRRAGSGTRRADAAASHLSLVAGPGPADRYTPGRPLAPGFLHPAGAVAARAAPDPPGLQLRLHRGPVGRAARRRGGTCPGAPAALAARAAPRLVPALSRRAARRFYRPRAWRPCHLEAQRRLTPRPH